MDMLIFEVGIAVALITLTGLISARLRFSVIPFYILIGMAVGPHAPQIGIVDLRFIESSEFIEFMGRLGILFLLFYLGLEFSVSRLMKSGKAILTGGMFYVGLNFASGLLLGWFMELPLKETLVVCGIMTSSSTAIVAKVLVDLKRTANPETEIIMGMIMFDDLFIAIHISILTGLVLSGATSFLSVLLVSLSALLFIVLFLIIGRKCIKYIDKALNIKSSELFLLTVMTLLFLVAGFSETLHVAEAIGALMMGLVLGESRHASRIEHQIMPFKDFFGAIFFFSFGLTIEPSTLGGAVGMTVIAVILTIASNYGAGMIAGRLSGMSPRASLNVGFTLVSRGEFSIIMANIGKAGGLMASIQSFAVLYVLILAVLGPILTKESPWIYSQYARLRKRMRGKETG
ncbi:MULTISPECIES: cation:proton antiporter [Paenibacillus]|uniref:cation:proton antiporter n=1 Tax=Paenibacillus TaxID=44249 RepID=UPI0008910015|nr:MULTISPECIES: cation:proton antiporter [Paenibacillus]MCZ1265852.1 cation:proton antiporter [Paenibacillus tundrae]SDL51458.1 potassium/proton antiporter membrane subunit, CPA2 family [Paenibacillus sp. OK060]SLK12200.1 potassium/proton antiporter membrane subunit, CPA2 family [Paenibacillus sp. RU5A]SOC72566.1 potassium/proton antiporter membrane subunit, CPA2 family [Paenibacillus sp. RU26A]SOC74959.1 potassium/proton antiporter membrane subunit, CPA2 family [Paenibacillus sp. RU5M]